MKTDSSDQIFFLNPESYASHGVNFHIYKDEILRFRDQWFMNDSPFLVQTSGSTGKPKTIEISREQMEASAVMTAQALNLNSSDNALICLNTRYIAGKMMLARSFTLGMTAYILPPVANPLKAITSSLSISFTAMAPYQIKMVLEESPDKITLLDQMKAILLGGAPVDPRLEEALQKTRGPVYSTYGMTETVSHIALRRLNGPDSSPAYTVLPGISVSVDARSCLTIKGSVTQHKTLITNDVVKLLSDNQFIWTGRIDNVINSGGIKIQIEELETSIGEIFIRLKYPHRFMITGIPDDRFGTIVVLLIEGYFAEQKKKELASALREKISKYELPKKIISVAKFSETATGKIDRGATRSAIM